MTTKTKPITRTLFDGCLSIADTEYTESAYNEDSEIVEVEVPNLTQSLNNPQPLSFQLQYPFEKSYQGSVKANANLKDIIKAIRSGFRQIYKATTSKAIPKLINREVIGKYGTALNVQ